MTTPVNNSLAPQVQQWLHRVIAPEYADPQRTYNDVAAALFGISTLFPRTEVYTHEDGRSQLLLNVHGTIPVIFRGATYNIPLTVWLPHQYPRQPPVAFVTPARDMLIRPGNHVDPNGRCYHPYLANWVNFSDGSNIVDLCNVLRGVFGREPPVYSKQTPVARPVSEAPPPPLPPLPSELVRQSPVPSLPATPVPPPLPPLPREMVGSSPAAAPSPVNARYSSYQQQRVLSPRETANGNGDVRGGGSLQGYRDQGPPPPPLPPLPPAPHRAAQPQHQQQAPPYHAAAPPYPAGIQPTAMTPMPSPHPTTPAQGSRSPPPAHQYMPPPNRFPGAPSPPMQPLSLFHAFPSHSPPIYPANSQFYHIPVPPPQTSPPKPPPPLQPKNPPPIDIMSLPAEAPPSLSSPSTSSPPPPPPPNPEKDRLLQQISQALHARAEAAYARTATTLEQAAAQREALTRAEAAMERERAELARIVDLCEKDSDILRERIAAAGEVIKDAEAREAPEIDAVVVAPTVVHTQLYDLVTEDMAIEDTIYVLGKALDKERISLDVFLKYTRTLAREQFLLRALVKKITSQIGVDE